MEPTISNETQPTHCHWRINSTSDAGQLHAIALHTMGDSPTVDEAVSPVTSPLPQSGFRIEFYRGGSRSAEADSIMYQENKREGGIDNSSLHMQDTQTMNYEMGTITKQADLPNGWCRAPGERRSIPCRKSELYFIKAPKSSSFSASYALHHLRVPSETSEEQQCPLPKETASDSCSLPPEPRQPGQEQPHSPYEPWLRLGSG